MFFTWAKYGCDDANYIFKGDDDTLINPFALQDFLTSENRPDPVIYGCLLVVQPVQKKDKTNTGIKYGDTIWPEATYPTYVSGGGFVINRMAMLKVQEMIKITPMIPIDDAFIGICLRRAGLELNIIRNEKFKSWGFKPFDERRFDVCEIDKVIYYHSFLPKEINCFWPKFIEHRSKCQEPGFKFEEDLPLCNPKDWHRNHAVASPILDGADYHHCGPDWGNAGCSVKPEDWTIRQPNNGPCCSPNGYCGITNDHCKCADCVDFRKVENDLRIKKAHMDGVCCKTLLVQSSLTYTGTYSLTSDKAGTSAKDSKGYVLYDKIVSQGKEKFTIQHGGFSKYGIGWYILVNQGGGLAWFIDNDDACPPIGNWEGYGAVVSCVRT